jgi:hypothetical protein
MKSGLWLNGWGTLSTPVGLRRLLAAARISRFAHATEPEANKPRLQFPSKSAGVRVLLQHRHRAMKPASAVALPVSLGGAPCGRRLRVQQPANSDSSGGVGHGVGRPWLARRGASPGTRLRTPRRPRPARPRLLGSARLGRLPAKGPEVATSRCHLGSLSSIMAAAFKFPEVTRRRGGRWLCWSASLLR